LGFFTELRRRNVFRVGAAYVVLGWLLLQVTDILLPMFALPDWVARLVLFLLLLGFPLSLVFAWAFELTPEGVRRESRTEAAPSASGGQRKRLDYVILAGLLLALAYFAWQHDWGGDQETMGGSDLRSIVVLPFENLMNDPEQAFFVAGMHEALITELSKIDALRVISRTSAMSFKDSGKSVPEIARELDVDAAVEGSVLRAGNVVRVTVQLIEANADRHLWAENFDRELSDILALYSEVTQEIARQVRITLTADEKAEIVNTRPVDPEVYELYLKGRFLCENWSPEEMEEGTRLLQEAVSLDPGHAPAHAQLALCLQYEAFFGYQRPLDVLARSRAAAEMAARLDGQLAEAQVALAGIVYYLEYEPREAKQALEKALELNPASVKALLHLSWLLGESGQFAEALEYNRRALSLDPLSTVVNHALGQLYYLNRDFERAIVEFEKTLELDRSDPSLHYSLAWPYEQTGRFEEAIRLHRKAVELSRGASLYRAALGHALGVAGMREQATEILQGLLVDPDAAPYDKAIVYLGLDEHEQAIDWLEKAFEVRDSHLIYINRGPRFDPLRGHPRFIRLLERIDWPEADAPLPKPDPPGRRVSRAQPCTVPSLRTLPADLPARPATRSATV
jgi:TolB-like protein/Tfp pilus assembly protein PilF